MALMSAVLPVYPNADSLPRLMKRLSSAVDLTGDMVEIVFVDGGSGEESFDILRRFAEESVPSRRAWARNEALWYLT